MIESEVNLAQAVEPEPISVRPVAITHIDFPNLIKKSTEVLGFCPSTHLDRSHREVQTLPSYLSILDSINMGNKHLNQPPGFKFENAVQYFENLFFVFLVEAPKVFALEAASFGPLTISGRENLNVISGTFDRWFRALEIGCQYTSSFESRYILNLCCLFFEQVGLISSNFKKSTLDDKSFILRRV